MRHFEALVDQHRHRIYTFAYYFLGERDEAEDATQEVLIRLWRHTQEGNEAPLQGWITRVTRNVCLDALRRRKTYRSVFRVDTGEVEVCAGNGPSPHLLLESAELRAKLEHALARLGEPYRSIVILREIQDLTYEQICEALGLPLTTVKVYLHRGRKALRESLHNVASREPS